MLKIVSFFIFLLPFQVALSPAEDVDLALSRLLVILLALSWFLAGLKNKKLFIDYSWQSAFLASFLFLASLSLFWVENINWGARKLFFLFSVMPVFWPLAYLVKTKGAVLKITKSFVKGAFLVAILGIVQFSLQFFWGLEKTYSFWAKNMAPLFFGEAFSSAVLKNPSWLVNISGNTLLRATATFPDPHMFSFFLNLALFSCLGVIIYLKKKGLVYVVMLGFLLLANLLTFSRGGYLGLFSGLVIFLIFFWKGINKKYRIGMGIMFLLIVSLLVFKNPVSQRFWSSFDFSEGSNVGRLEIWNDSLSLILEHPGGVGLGNYSLAINPLAEYRDPIYAHNTYLDIISETGLQGGLVWLLFLFSIILSLYRKSKKNPLFFGFFLAGVAFAAHSLVETPLFSPVVMIAFLILAAFSTIKVNEENNQS